jgi:hypothetical protein
VRARSRKVLSIVLISLFLIQSAGLVFPFKAIAALDWDRYSQELPPGIPREITVNGKIYEFNPTYWESRGLIVYGNPGDIVPNDYEQGEFRYLGYDRYGGKFTNQRFPDDVPNSVPLEDKQWVYKPWSDSNVQALPSAPPKNGNEWSREKEYWDLLQEAGSLDRLGWKPYGNKDFFGYFYIQSFPTLEKTGSMRGWHWYNGQILYKTITIPTLLKRNKTNLTVKTEILTNDFTIDADENTVDLKIKVSARLEDDEYYNDPYRKVLNYTRDDVEGYWIKLEYKGLLPYVWLPKKNSNTAENTFLVTLDRRQIVDKEKVIFNGIGRVKFKNGVENVNNDIQEAIFTVIAPPPGVNPEYPPGLNIIAPETANIKENFTVEVKPVAAEGENITSLALEGSFNNGAWKNISLSNNKATVSYPAEGKVDFRASAVQSNGLTAQATATTILEDNRAATAKAGISLSSNITYEGYPITAYNENIFYFDGKSYNAKEADNEGIGDSEIEYYDSGGYELESGMYSSTGDTNTSREVTIYEDGNYLIGCIARPINGEEDEDREGLTVKPCPHIEYTLIGTRKDDRRLTLDFSGTKVHPQYPLIASKTYVEIEDTSTGEKVKVTNSSAPDSTHIKTLSISNNKFDFLIKAAAQKTLNITIYVEDTRGESDTITFEEVIEPDLPPVADITASLLQYRDTNGVAKVKIGKSGYSPDGDILTVNDIKYRVDTDNDGSFSDETLVNLSSSLTEKEAIITTDKVGKILLEYTVKEDLTPSTIPQFVTSSDYQTASSAKIIDVDNLNPHTSLRVIGSADMDLFTVGEHDSISTIQTKIQQMKSSINASGKPVDLVAGTGESAFSDTVMEAGRMADSISGSYIGYDKIGNNEYWYAYKEWSSYGSDIYVRDFETGSIVEYFPGGAAIIHFAGEWMFISSSQGIHYYNPQTKQKSLLTYAGGNIEYKENLDLTFYSQYINNKWTYGKVFDNKTGAVYELTGNILDGIDMVNAYREGNNIYYITRTDIPDGYGKEQYTLNSYNITTGKSSVLNSYTTDYLYNRNIVLHRQKLDNGNIVMLDFIQGNKLNILICNFQAKILEHFATISFPFVRYYDIITYGWYGEEIHNYVQVDLAWNAAIQGPLIEMPDNNTMVFMMANMYSDGKSSPQYAFYLDMIKAARGSTASIRKQIYENMDTFSYIHRLFGSLDNSFTKFDYYKGRILFYYAVGLQFSDAPSLQIYDTNLNLVEELDIQPKHNLIGHSVRMIYDEYLRAGNLNTCYYLQEYSNGTVLYKMPEYSQIVFATGEWKRMYLGGLFEVNGEKWIAAYTVYGSFMESSKDIFFIKWSTGEVYTGDFYTMMQSAEYNFGMYSLVKDEYIWMIHNLGGVGFNTETKQFIDLPDFEVGVKGFMNSDSLHKVERYGGISAYIFPERFKSEVNKYLDSITARDNSQKYIIFISDNALTLSSADINHVANKIKIKGFKTIWIGNAGNTAAGQAIVNITGGTVLTFTSINDAFSQLQSYLISQLPAKEQMYVVNVKKGETISYDKFYFDLEGDSQIPSTVQWYYRHVPSTDGYAPFSQTWLNEPVTSFDRNGTYYVSWRVKDNPKPADTDSRFAPYRKDSIREEMMIVVGNAEPPPEQVVEPVLVIRVGGSLKQNRKVTATLDVIPGTNGINDSTAVWTYEALSGGSSGDIKVENITTTSKELLFKQPGTYRLKAEVKDTKGNTFSTQKDITVVPDLPVTGSLTIEPEKVYRDNNANAKVKVKVEANSQDDYISNIYYYFGYDANNDGALLGEGVEVIELTDKRGQREFELEVSNGVGYYGIGVLIQEGFSEETIPEFVSDSDYSSISLYSDFTVDNLPPLYSIRPEKDVYLVGEEIRYISNIHGNRLNGDYTKGYFDDEGDPMSYLKVKYIQDRAAMNNQDSVSAYHDMELTELLPSLDRAGKYTLEANAGDDPKGGDTRFDSYKKDSNTSTNTFIVHRRPAAQASFAASHPSAINYNFGNNMFLEGTKLIISDASYDPDGFNVSTILSWKQGSGSYEVINPGDVLTLFYGDKISVRVETEDNWGAQDVQLYTVTVVNDLDMVPEIIPSPVPASENVTLRLTTNQYAVSARAEIIGQDTELALVSETSSEKVWEARYAISPACPDGNFTARFYASSEGMAELWKDKAFEVSTPINLVPDMPQEVAAGSECILYALTTKYANFVTVNVFSDTPYSTSIILTPSPDGDNIRWTGSFTVPEDIPEGAYNARFRAATPNGNVETRDIGFTVRTLKITGVSLKGSWNHWRGQVDIFGRQMGVEPHRFLSLEAVNVTVETSGFAEKIIIRFSPELEAMSYTNSLGHIYDYEKDFMGYRVDFPEDSTILIGEPKAVNSANWEYVLPLAPDTKSWGNERQRQPYRMEVYAYRGESFDIYIVDDIEITGSIYDLTYIQPVPDRN